MLSVYLTSLVVEQRVDGGDFSDFPCLALGRNSVLTSDDMADLRQQGINVGNDNGPTTKNISDEVPQPVNV